MARTPIHPGEHLAEELKELGISAAELARQIDVPVNRVTGVINGQRSVTADTALRLGHWFGTSGEYWLNLEQMKHHYDANKMPDSKGIFVCIHLFSEAPLTGLSVPYMQNGIRCGFELVDTSPREAPAGTALLGYDVADASWISGLTNCGYAPEDKKRLSSSWLPRLNSYGLLKELDDAIKFRDVSNLRAPDHAPFWVFGISQFYPQR